MNFKVLNKQNSRISSVIIQPDKWPIIAAKIVPKFNTDHLAAKFTNNYFQLQAANTDVSRAIQCFITKNNITFHTFLHPSEPKLNVLLRVKPIL